MPSGHYACAECERPLFSSVAKFAHSTPWPAFEQTIEKDSLHKKEEKKGTYKVDKLTCAVFDAR